MGEKVVAVLGRGKSLEIFKKFHHLFKTIYIVGNFYKEIKKMGVKYLENKEIIHLVSRTDHPLRNNYYEKLNIARIQTMYSLHQLQIRKKKNKKTFMEKFEGFEIKFLPDYMKDRGYPLVDRSLICENIKKYNNYKKMCDFFEKNFEEEIKKGIENNNRLRYWPTTGIYAIDLCLVEQKPEKIYIFGIDCYKAGSYSKYNWEKKERDHSLVKPIMLYHIEQMTKEFPFIHFYSSCNKINFNAPNWSSI